MEILPGNLNGRIYWFTSMVLILQGTSLLKCNHCYEADTFQAKCVTISYPFSRTVYVSNPIAVSIHEDRELDVPKGFPC